MSIVLCMIVRDEEKMIVPTLESVLPFVDDAVIVDTGSVDRTVELIHNRCTSWWSRHKTDALGQYEAMPYVVHSRPWVDFSTNRNECLELARERLIVRLEERWQPNRARTLEMLQEHWLLMLSSDCRIHGPSHELRAVKEGLAARLPTDGTTAMQLSTQLGNWRYPQTCLFRADSDWRYEGLTHEVAVSPSGQRLAPPPPGIWVEYLGGGDKRKRWLQDAVLLQRQLKEERGKNARTLFYLGQTYELLGEYEEAARWYQARVKAGGWAPERWEARLRLGCLDHVFTEVDRGEYFLACTKEEPSRAEAWFYHAEMRALQAERGIDGLWECAYQMARVAVQCVDDAPARGREDIFFIRRDIYDFRAYMLLAVCAYHTGRNKEARNLFELVLSFDDTRCHPSEGERLMIEQHLATLSE